MKIRKAPGQTPTESFLLELCERTFLKLWCHANPFKSDGKELCDLLAVFENHVFIFFDRESKKFDNTESDIALTWERWKRNVIENQIRTAEGAKNYISQNPGKIFLDSKLTFPFPINISSDNIQIHKIIVAHGASNACKKHSEENVSGSLGISYTSKTIKKYDFPFLLNLERTNPVHVLDSHNLEIILSELDTFYDLTSYITAKEKAIIKYDFLIYCGEEDLLAHYYSNFDASTGEHFIGVKDEGLNGIFIAEGGWQRFIELELYKRRRMANKGSYQWDDLIQKASQEALDGSLVGNADVFNYNSAIKEMAMEPRFIRRGLSEAIENAIHKFPDKSTYGARMITFCPSFNKDKGYVFLQLALPDMERNEDYRKKRINMLEIACGVAKNTYPALKKVIGIGVDAPKYHDKSTVDFILLDCVKWTYKQKEYYEKINKVFLFFQDETSEKRIKTFKNFPDSDGISNPKLKIGRNEKCPCGSGKKYKQCHGCQSK